MEESRLEDSLRQCWSQYLTTVIPGDKSKYLELFLKEFLKTYFSVDGHTGKMPSFGDIHSVSNILAREFQDIILAKCQEGDEELLVKYLCKGPGLMLLEVLCILANKIAGCSSALAHLLVTILPVLFRVPPIGHDMLQGLEVLMLEWENYFQDPKAKPYHSITIQKMILKHCDDRFASPASSTNQASLLDSEEKTLTSKQDATISCGLVLPLKESTDSSSVADESDILTSISSVSSMGSMGILSSNPSDSSSSHEVQFHRQSSGISSLVESTETPNTVCQTPESSGKEGKEKKETAESAEESGQDLTINTLELFNLILSVLENLCCRDISSCDTTLTMKTAGQLIDIILCIKDGQKESLEEIYCAWDSSSCVTAQLSMLITVLFFLYTTFKNPKSAKQLVRSSYVKNLVALVENALSNAVFTAEQLEELAEEIEHLSQNISSECQSECFGESALWKQFHYVLFFSYSLQGLLSFLCSSLQFGTLINSSLLALSRELFEQFVLNDGFEHVISAVLKMEDMMVTSPGGRAEGPGSESVVIPPIPQAIRDLPRVNIFHMLSVIGKVISLVKNGKSYCRVEVEIPTRRKSEESYLQFQPPVNLMTSDVEESSESTGDMEMENDKRSRTLGDQCQILIPVTSLLTMFKTSKTQYLSCQVITCLGKVGVCSCIKPDDLIGPLLTRYFQRPRLLQTQILRLINQLILTALDDPFVTPKPQETQTNAQNTSRTRTKKTYSKSPKSSPSKGNGGVWGEMLARSPRHVTRIPQEYPSWSCLSQYCSLLTSGDSVLAFETAKSLKPLVVLGSVNLKDELFRIVLLPSIFRFDSRRNKSFSVQADYPSKGSDLPDSTCLIREKISLPEERRTRSQSSSCYLTKDVLRLLLGYLPSLLVSSSSKGLFFSCGGLTQLQMFLEEEELQPLVIEVFEFLASLEDRSNSLQKVKTVKTKDEELECEEKENTSKEELATALRAFLVLLRDTAKIELSKIETESTTNATQEGIQEDDSKAELKRNASSCHDQRLNNKIQEHTRNQSADQSDINVRTQDCTRPLMNLTLRYHVWKACLNLLVSNKLFVELFVADSGPIYSFELLDWLFSYFSISLHTVDSRNDKDYSDAVALFEVILAVCIRMAYAGFWKDQEGISNIDSLLSQTEQTVLNSPALKTTLGRGLCDSFTKVSIKTLLSVPGFTQQDGTEVMETSYLFNQGGACETEAADWSQLMIDDDMDGPMNSKSKAQEDGYEADNEVNSDSSDDDKIVRQTSQPRKNRDRRKSEESRDSSVHIHGLVIYPQICQFLFRLLNAAFGPEEACSKTSKSLSVLTHAVQCVLGLVKDNEHNCRVLCQEGLLSSVLMCYQDVLSCNDESLRDLQSIVLDLFVHLANHQIKASELKDFIAIFKTRLIPVDLLCNSLAHVASKASHGPAYILSFPCRLQTVDPRSKHGGRKAKVQRLRPDMKRIKGGVLLQSLGDASSEGANSEGSLSRIGKNSPERPRRSKTQSKLARGGPVETGDRQDMQRSESNPGDDTADLPSPFSVKAINLRCHGNQTWPPPDFSIVFWIRLHSLRRFSESEPGMSREATRLRGMIIPPVHGTRSSRSMSCPNVWTRGTDTPSCDEAIHICSIGSRKGLFEIWVLPSGGSLLFRWTKATKGGTDGYDIVKELVTRIPGLSRGRWHHVVVSFSQSKQRYIPPNGGMEMKEYDDACKILSIVDGTEATEQNFGPLLSWYEEGKCTLSACLLGHVILSTAKKEGHGAEKSVLPEGYDLGNVLAFIGGTSSKSVKKRVATHGDWVVGKDEAFYLYSLGPNYNSIGHLHANFSYVPKDYQDSSQPFLVASRLWSRLSITERSVSAGLSTGFLRSPHVFIPDLETSLKSKLLLSYTPVHHTVFNQNISIPTTDDKPRRASHLDVTNKPTVKTNLVQNEAKLFLEVEALRVSTFLEAAHDIGGMTVFIYLLAKVVEMTKDHKTQADALSIVLSLQKTCEYHARAMDEESGYALLKRILLSPQCMIGYHVLKVLMEAACDGEVFKHTNLSDNPIMLNIDSNAVVRNVDIFQHYLLNRNIWDKAKQGVLEMLLSTLEILVHASHPHYKFNIDQFQKAELVQQLLIGCQERQGEGLKEIPSTISTLYVNIIQNVMGQTPDLTVLKAVCEFLIAIHPTEDTTSLHSPNRFYLMEYKFDFGYPTPAVIRLPLSPSSFQRDSLLMEEKLRSPSSPYDSTLVEPKLTHSDDILLENLETSDSTVRLGRNGTLIGEEGKEGEKERIGGSISEQMDEEEDNEGKCFQDMTLGQKGDKYVVIKEESPAHSSPQAIAPHFASCPPPSIHRKLTVQIPHHSAASSVKPYVGSADGSSILLQGSPLREWKTSVSSPSTPQTPPTPHTPHTPVESYRGPGSKPLSIGIHSNTPKSRMSSVDVMEYDFINESDFSSLKSSLAHQSSMDEYLVVEGYPGIKSSTQTYKPNNSEKRRRAPDHMTKMRLGLLKLLQKILLNLQTEQVPAVIGGVLKAEYLLVWVSHQSDSVRELVIKILCLYLQKAEAERYNHFLGIHGFHLLANQLYDHTVTKGTIEACLWLMVGRPVDLDKDYAYSTAFDQNLSSTLRPLGVVPLLSVLENTLISQNLNRMLIKHLCQLFLKIDDLCLNAVAHGLLQTVCNVVCGLARLQHQQNQGRTPITIDVSCLMDDLQTLISCIVIKACSTCGSMYFQMFEDLLVVLENLEELDHRKREYGVSIFFIARYLRYFAIQVALYFFQEICKDEIPFNGRKRGGIRLFRGSEKSSDLNPFKPVSSWIPLSPDHNLPCSDLGFLKTTPTSANFNEQTQRFQSVVQMAVNCVTYSRTVFLNDALGPLQVYTADLKVHEALRPGILKGATNGVNMDKEFAQFIFSLLFEFLDTCLDNKGTMPSKVMFMSKEIIKSQLGKLLVYLLSPSQSLDLSCFVLQISEHVRAKKLIQAVLTSNGGGKLRDKIQAYLPKLLSMERLSEDQASNALSFKSLLEACGLRFSALNESSGTDVETQSWDHAETTNIMEWQKKRQEAFAFISKRIVALNSKVSESARIVTRVAVEIQDTQRQTLLKNNRDGLSAEVQIRKKWRQVIERLIHERSVWYDREYFPVSWRLDPTEGPLRVRCRMQRCHLDVPQKYVMEGHQKHATAQSGSPLAYLFEDSTSCHKKNVYYIFDTPDTIRFLYHCMHILLDIKTTGVILIGEIHMYFIGEEATTADTDVTQILLGNKDAISISWAINEIQEIRTRRYCLKDIGMEIFLSNGRTYLLAFDSEKDREVVIEEFKQRRLPIYDTPISDNLNATTAKWRTGNLSNFEYLTELNKMAGRTFNDLMQYPVFPFILSDFTSEVLDLTDSKVFRDLSKPIAAQSINKEASYKERFRWLKEEYERSGQNDALLAPYHYGSHYSNSGTVLHFLVRLPPFTKMFLQYQDNNFDIPDRTFHSMATTWRLSSYESSTDVKELIPEFFVLPEFLENFEGFDFGLRQNGERVMNVTLPPWAKGNPRLFILIHRQALETEYVSRSIHSWIDLVFGFKQTGNEAVEAVNVFHPATYYGVQVSSITDPVRQKALKTMIETYGQTPRQLFIYPHSPRLTRKISSPAEFGSMTSLNTSKFDFEVASATNLFMHRFTGSFSSENTLMGSVTDTLVDAPKPVTTVEGLRWGSYVCSPALPVPFINFNQQIGFPVCSLVCNRGEVVHVLCKDTTLMSGYEQYPEERGERLVLSAALSWSSVDGSLTVFVEGSGSGAWLMDTKTPDKITCCVTSIGCTSLFIGSSSGALFCLHTKYNPTLDCRIEVLGIRVRLYGHTNEITCLKICHEYSVLVSGSKDGTAIIWDLNRLSYIRTLDHKRAVDVLAISRTSGDIATVSHHGESLDQDSIHEEGSVLSLWTVNGIPVAYSTCEHTINCMDFSRAPEGVSVNIIATGLINGAIRLWSTWDLQHIRDIAPEQNLSPIASVAFSEDSQRLFALSTQGRLIVWQRRDKTYGGRPPIVVTFPVSYTAPKVPQDSR